MTSSSGLGDTGRRDSGPSDATPGAAASEEDFSEAEMEQLLRAATRPPQAQEPERVGRLLWAAAATPAIALALLASMALRVRFADGAWPVRNQPDPKDLGFHNSVTVAAILLSFAVVFLLPLGTLLAFFAGRRRIPIGPPLLALVGFAVLALVLRADVGGLGEWIAD